MPSSNRRTSPFTAAYAAALAAGLLWSAGVAAQTSPPPVPSDVAPPVKALPNRVTPPPSLSGPLPDSPRIEDRKADDNSPLLDPETPWSPRTPRLPNASPDEPPLVAPLFPIEP